MEYLGILFLFYIPYFVVMFMLGRKATFDAKFAQGKYVRSIVYDGAAYAFDKAAEYKAQGKTLTDQEKFDLAYNYIKKDININKEDAERFISSTYGKVSGVGASGEGKVK